MGSFRRGPRDLSLRASRLAADISLAEAGARTGIGADRFSEIERGIDEPTSDEAAAIEQLFLDYSIEELLSPCLDDDLLKRARETPEFKFEYAQRECSAQALLLQVWEQW